MSNINQEEILQLLKESVEGSAATSDLLMMLCLHFASALPKQAISLSEMIQGILDSDDFQKSELFAANAHRAIAALTTGDVYFVSFTNKSRQPLSPEELRRHFRVIPGKDSET